MGDPKEAAMTPESARQFLEDHDVKFVLAQFVDIHGVAKTKAVPAAFLMDVVNEGAGFAGIADCDGLPPNCGMNWL